MKIAEVFASPQGEGAMVGTPYLFVRLAGCNLRCNDEAIGRPVCDTDFVGGYERTTEELLHDAGKYRDEFPGLRWLCFTGGEPTLQLDDGIVGACISHGWRIAVETNGTLPVPAAVHHVTVSPKIAWHALKVQTADEVRIVRRHGQAIPAEADVLRFVVGRRGFGPPALFVSPAFDRDGRLDPRDVQWCIEQTMAHPGWRLSVQVHKLLGQR